MTGRARAVAAAAASALAVFMAGARPADTADVQPLTIHAILSLTGSASFLGREEAESLHDVETRVNQTGGIRGRPVTFAIADDQSSPVVDLQLFAGISKDAHVVIGPSLVGGCSAIEPLTRSGPVVYCLSAGMTPQKGGSMFAYGIPTRELLRVTVAYFRDRGWKRIGAIFPTDATGQDGERGFDLALAANPGTLAIDRQHYNNDDVSVSAQIAHLAATHPDAIIAWGTGAPLGTVFHAIHDLGVDVPVAISASNLNYKEIAQFRDILPRRLFVVCVPGVAPEAVRPGPLHDAAAHYFDTVKATGVQPDGNLVIGWDPGTIVVDALRTLGPDASAAQLRDYLLNLHGWFGAAGEYDFRDGSQRGLTGKTAIVVQYDETKARFVPVSRLGGAPLGGST